MMFSGGKTIGPRRKNTARTLRTLGKVAAHFLRSVNAVSRILFGQIGDMWRVNGGLKHPARRAAVWIR